MAWSDTKTVYPRMVTRLSTNPARRRVTLLIRLTMLPLSQTATITHTGKPIIISAEEQLLVHHVSGCPARFVLHCCKIVEQLLSKLNMKNMIIRLCFHPCLFFFCLFVCVLDCSKSYERILIKLLEGGA